MVNNVSGFTIKGTPPCQKRHRHVVRGRFAQIYDPSSDDKKDFLEKCIPFKPKAPFEGAVYLFIKAVYERPKSHYSKSKKTPEALMGDAPIHKVSKPDSDNITKFVKDALNKVFWVDDSQVIQETTSKRWADPGEESHVLIHIYQI